MKKVWQLLLRVLILYLVVGLVAGISSYVQLELDGKTAVFSPWVGIPLSILDWPGILRADLLRGRWNFQSIATLITLAAGILGLFIWRPKK